MDVAITVFFTAAIMIVVERLWPGRSWPKVSGWWVRAALLNGVQLGIVYLSGVAWNGWLVAHRPWSADALGRAGGIAAGYIVHTFVYYWWHRWRHQSQFLWRWFHQVHHSPQRIEIITSFYKHPLEIFINGLISSFILYIVVGLDEKTASLAFLLSGLAELVYHWNVATPHWLGYVIQRPESHCLHHQEGVHAYNYGDLPIFDMMFGTFRNPQKWQSTCGFGDRNEARLREMLLGREIVSGEGHK